MKTIWYKTASTWIFTCVCFFLYTGTGFAAGLLKPLDGSKDGVRMKSHHVNVTINNGFARTEVDQIFMNTTSNDLEAVYSFPLPKQASLSELSLWIDGNEVMGEVLGKKKAQKVYEDQKAKGNDTALAEKNAYKTFDVNVYPVRANDETRIRLVYYQPVEIDLNIGRYVYPLEEGGVDDNRASFWSVDNKVSESLTFNLELKSAFPIRDIRIPKYEDQAKITQTDAQGNQETYHVNLDLKDTRMRTRAIKYHVENDITDEGGESAQSQQESFKISLDLTKEAMLSKDIVCYYRLDDTAPARLELIPYKADKHGEGTFMAVVTPGASLQPIEDGTDWTFVLDVSGSMAGEKINALVDGVSQVIGSLSGKDRFRIVTFNDNARDYTLGYVDATRENIDIWLTRVRSIQSGGSTNLFAGISQGYKGLDADRTTGLVLVTDGVANVGETRQAQMVDFIRKYDYRLFTFVIGNSANQPLLDSLAKNSGGFAMNISSSDDIVGRLIQAKAKVLHECLYDAKLTFHGETVSDLTPSSITHLYMGQQWVMFGKYSHAGDIEIELTGKIGNEKQSWTCRTTLPEINTDNPEIERLWALSSIEDIMDEIRMKGKSDRLAKKVIDLGVEYSLVTDYTSMVVVNETEMESMGLERKNADRVSRERKAQAEKKNKPAKNYRADNRNSSDGMFHGRSSHSVGSGPVGPLFIVMVAWIRRKMSRS